ncbi:MAG: T9SS type A sorting domain-containing protein [Flavobacteriales bacterium]|nr:hypothetical protein [Flavobacteriales bacterium]MCC6578233.1 T9SS type A sorting domain-containing protein [Flavobacteriales bacterium]NUQ14324.1 T9SS type A sorting domain-containing protein [Flavobacteriales bacterium]
MRAPIIAGLLCLIAGDSEAQQEAAASGGEATGPGGTVSWTIGQVADLRADGTGGTALEGVQQPFDGLPTGTAPPPPAPSPLVWPTLARQAVHVDLRDPAVRSVRVQVLDALGRVVLEHRARQVCTTVPIDGLAAGRYLLRLTGNGRPAGTFDLIKTHDP